MKIKLLQGVEIIIILNFLVSAMLMIIASVLSLSEHYSFFEFNQELYGELINHLKITILYLAITEIIICVYCALTKNTQGIALAGFFMILMVGSMNFYEKINDISLDENLYLFFLYTGCSHILFGVYSELKKQDDLL